MLENLKNLLKYFLFPLVSPIPIIHRQVDDKLIQTQANSKLQHFNILPTVQPKNPLDNEFPFFQFFPLELAFYINKKKFRWLDLSADCTNLPAHPFHHCVGSFISFDRTSISKGSKINKSLNLGIRKSPNLDDGSLKCSYARK